jgi:glycosyltransferase involved in cell wall biosynthesis
MNICHIWDADYPWDVRVEKICSSLLKQHEVHLVCRNSLRRARYECIDGLHIHRLPCLPKRFGALNRVIGFPAFFNPLWIWILWKTIRRTRADVLIVRDLPLALTAIGLGRAAGIPVVLDMAENYPAMIGDLKTTQGFSFLDFFVRNPGVVRAVERLSLRHSDHVLVVVDESRDRVVSAGTPDSKVTLVINTPSPVHLASAPPLANSQVPGTDATLTLVYLGILEKPRGLETAIRAIELASRSIPGLKLRVIGSGRHEQDFRALVDRLNLQQRVEFVGWLDHAAAIRAIEHADVGLVPHHVTEHSNSTIPNKLFDYMAKGKAVIVSDAKPLQRIVREERCGVVFRDQDSSDLARAIAELEPDAIRVEMGRRGMEAIARKYNWANDEARLLRAIETAVRGRRG